MVVAKKARLKMALPEVERVVYETNPLDQVICQFRFPRILRLETEPPAAFQEHVGSTYPLYRRNPVGLLAGFPPQFVEFLGQEPANHVGHEFLSADDQWTLRLAADSVALTCKNYRRWEEFRERLNNALDAFLKSYSPSFFVRIGLRYRNVIRRSRLGLEDAGWADLLKPWILGAYAAPETRDEVEHLFLQTILRLPEERGRALITSGTVKDDKTGEDCFLIDADFFTEQQTESQNAAGRLDFLNHQSDLFFQWCVGPRLHDALSACPVVASA